jgi:DNA repair exonuclease SbcCD ATPase subunit
MGIRDVDTTTIQDKLKDPSPLKKQKIKYLTQSFVERVCDYKNSDDLAKQIESIIFQNSPVSQRGEYLDFQDYKDDQLRIIKNKQKSISKSIKVYNEKLFDIINTIKNEDDLKRQKIKILQNIKTTQEEFKKLKSKEAKKDVKIISQLDSLNENNSKKEKIVSKFNKNLLLKDELLYDVQSFIEEANTFVEELKAKLKKLGLPSQVIEKIKISLLPNNLASLIEQHSDKIKRRLEKEEGELEKYENKIKQLTNSLRVEESRKEKLNENNKKKREYSKTKDNIERELNKIKEYKKELPVLESKRIELFKEIFYQMQREYLALKNMYSPITRELIKESESETRLFDFYVKYSFDVELMAEAGDELIDHSKRGRHYQKNKNTLLYRLA